MYMDTTTGDQIVPSPNLWVMQVSCRATEELLLTRFPVKFVTSETNTQFMALRKLKLSIVKISGEFSHGFVVFGVCVLRRNALAAFRLCSRSDSSNSVRSPSYQTV